MTYAELMKALHRRSAAIVHFSHIASTRAGCVFPVDLQEAIAHRHEWPLSCSVVWPCHPMGLVGTVGLILRPTTVANILSVSNADSGSSQGADRGEQSFGCSLSAKRFEACFEVKPGHYNEWRVIGADVGGIFVTDPNNLEAKKRAPILLEGKVIGEEIGPFPISLQEVFEAFPDHRVFTMDPRGLNEIPRSALGAK